MLRTIVLSFLVLMLGATDVDAQRPAPPAPPTPVTEAASQEDLQELAYRVVAIEAREEIAHSSTDRLEVLIGAFGVVLAIVILAFAWNTREAAISAAVSAVSKQVEDIRKLRSEAEALVQEMELKYQLMTEHYRTVSRRALNQTLDSEGDRTLLARFAGELAKRDITTLTEGEFEIMIGADAARADWTMVRDHAILMRQLIKTASAECHALFSEACAATNLGQLDDAIAIYDQVIAKRADCADEQIVQKISRAMFNRAYVLGKLQRKFSDEISGYDDIILHFSGSADPVIRDAVVAAHYNRACAFAEQNDCDGAIRALKQLEAFSGQIDHDEVATDEDFAKIRNHPSFSRFLRECTERAARKQAVQ